MTTTDQIHDLHEQYVEIVTDDHGRIIRSRIVCEDGTIIKDWN